MTVKTMTLNGKPYELGNEITIAALVRSLDLNATQVAIERNRTIVPRARWDEVILSEGDEVEVVRLIGGG
jgi:sulfur carrier protein